MTDEPPAGGATPRREPGLCNELTQERNDEGLWVRVGSAVEECSCGADADPFGLHADPC